MKSSRAARDLIKAHEPFLATAERRGKRWVVGYGHTAAAKEGVSLKPEDAELLLIYDVMRAEQTLDACVGAEMAAPMRDALVSFALSVGLRAFKVSDVARLARDGRHREAAAAIETWVRADQDGRLVVSDRLVARRAAEKALYLSGLEDSAAQIDAPVSPVAEPEAAEPVAEPVEVSQAPVSDVEQEAASQDEVEVELETETPASEDAAPVAEPDAQADVEQPGLVELDIAFEFPEDDREVMQVETAMVSEAEPAPEAEPVEQGEAPAEDEASSDAEPETVREEPAPLAVSEDAPAEEAEDVKAAQDAAIAQVMARMARQVSASIAPASAPVAQAEAEAPVQLGYSFLSTAHVGLPSQAPRTRLEETAAPVVRPNAASSSLFSSPSVPLSALQSSLKVSTIKVTPIAPQALPQAATEEVKASERAAELADREDVISVDVNLDQDAEPIDRASETQGASLEVFSAPPHPALAPASAPGMSGDVEGPDHPDKDAEDVHADIHEDADVLDPADVSGGETAPFEDAEPSQRQGGDVMFYTSLGIGAVMVGIGGWDVVSNMGAYMDLGLSYSPLGPVVFGAGVLLCTASSWFIFGRRNEK
ncbi:glycoside hydrolase family protein [Oceanicaulis sp. LC35]|uniref:lysozyme n=1 Tax=Oceanicaulis sp. LC35 TaxID=3349635 RepID=UPI003F825DE9